MECNITFHSRVLHPEGNGILMKKGNENLTPMACRKIKERVFNYEIVPDRRLVFIDFAKRIGGSRNPVNHAQGPLAQEVF